MESLKLVEEARARGVDVTIDAVSVHGVQHRASRRCFRNGRWRAARRRCWSGWRAPEQRARIKAAIVENIKVDRGGGDPKNMAIANCAFDRTLAGKNLAEITRAAGS